MVYKTNLCDFRQDECKKKYCDKAHNSSDLRNIVALYYSDHQSPALQQIPEQPNESNLPPDFSSEDIDIPSISNKSLSSKQQKDVIIPPFDINSYKTMPCQDDKCSSNECKYYHNNLERRRKIDKDEYMNTYCQSVQTEEGKLQEPEHCPKKDNCRFCHTKNEFYYHPENFKKKPCKRAKCNYGVYCPDIHGNEEILTEQNEEIILERLEGECKEMSKKVAALRLLAKEWECPLCGNIMSDPHYTGIVLCCKYFLCSQCINSMEECFKCKEKKPKATFLEN